MGVWKNKVAEMEWSVLASKMSRLSRSAGVPEPEYKYYSSLVSSDNELHGR